MRSVTILVADDHELVRDGIKSRLEKQPGWKVCAVAANGREAVELALRLRPDVVLMDVGMKELNGLEAARQILKKCPAIAVLVLTLQESEDLIREALTSGVRGYILKTDAARLLTTAVEALLAGKTFFTGIVSDVLLKEFLQPKGTAENVGGAVGRLTMREREIVQLLAEGKTSKEIATRLGVSAKTIEAHRANVMRKLNLHSIAALVRYAVHNRIVEP
jgi:DNA-binding NarL/FixJ family response regulator